MVECKACPEATAGTMCSCGIWMSRVGALLWCERAFVVWARSEDKRKAQALGSNVEVKGNADRLDWLVKEGEILSITLSGY